MPISLVARRGFMFIRSLSSPVFRSTYCSSPVARGAIKIAPYIVCFAIVSALSASSRADTAPPQCLAATEFFHKGTLEGSIVVLDSRDKELFGNFKYKYVDNRNSEIIYFVFRLENDNNAVALFPSSIGDVTFNNVLFSRIALWSADKISGDKDSIVVERLFLLENKNNYRFIKVQLREFRDGSFSKEVSGFNAQHTC